MLQEAHIFSKASVTVSIDVTACITGLTTMTTALNSVTVDLQHSGGYNWSTIQ